MFDNYYQSSSPTITIAFANDELIAIQIIGDLLSGITSPTLSWSEQFSFLFFLLFLIIFFFFHIYTNHKSHRSVSCTDIDHR